MIYVDQFPGTGWGKWQGGGHLLTSDIDELHEFARKLGLKREWFQNKSAPHYDLTANKRRQAIELGAQEIGFGEFSDDMLMCQGEGYELARHRKLRMGWLLDD